jgi:glutamate dehydrogenase/leucine dehydrogenase
LLQKENIIFENSFFDNYIAEIFGMAFPDFNKEVIIWGAGNIGEKICWIMKRNGIKIECVLDSSSRKEEIDGIKIVNPIEYLRLNKSKNVIVAFKHNDEAIAYLNDIPNSQEIRYRTYSEIYEYAYQLYLQRRKQ